MSSLTKLLSVINLFSEDKSLITIDDIMEELTISAPTAYRYAKELCQAGIMMKVNSSEYTIGPRIIKLDYQIKNLDPMIVASKKIMQELVERTGFQVLLSNVYENEILNIHSEEPEGLKTKITYNRGKVHPLFKGATARIILANLSKKRLIELYHLHKDVIKQSNLGDTLDAFLNIMNKIKKDGYCITHGELDKGFTGIATPIFWNTNSITGSVTAVFPTVQMEILNIERIIEIMKDTGEVLSNIRRD